MGQAISGIIDEIILSGAFERLDRMLEGIPPEIAELTTKPLLDPKKVKRIYKKLGINSLDALKQMLKEGRIREQLGSRLEYHVRQGLDERPRRLLYSVEPIAEKIELFLRSLSGVTRVSVAGSLRRKQDTIGDLNYLVTGGTASSIFKQFAAFGAVHSSEPRSRFERLFHLSSGFNVSVRWTPAKEWGLALVLATGAIQHVQELEKRATKRKADLTSKALASLGVDTTTEHGVYHSLGLTFIEPELREGRGEVKAAAGHKLPTLVELSDLRGDLHMHTTASDGVNSIGEMAAAARARGYEYIAITDHSQSLKLTNGLSEDRLWQQIRNIDEINAKFDGFRILKSAEVDILEDGRLDYSPSMLKALDFTICSIHSRFTLDKVKQTERIMRAMDNRYFTILGHATGRLLLRREGYELDLERIVAHAKASGCFFEINSSPDRLDLSDEHAKMAKEQEVKISVNTDAHSTAELEFIKAGLNQARRAWLDPSDVLNTLPLERLIKLFKR